MKKLIYLLCILSTSCSYNKFNHVSPTNKIENTHYYALPKTAISISVPVTEIKYKYPVEFIPNLSSDDLKTLEKVIGMDTAIYLKLDSLLKINPIKHKTSKLNSYSKFKIEKPTLSYIPIIDTDKVYSIKQLGIFNKQDIALNYGQNGTISKLETSVESMIDDYVIATISAAGTLIGAVRGSGIDNLSNPELDELKVLINNHRDLVYNQSSRPHVNFEVYKDQRENLEKAIKDFINRHFYKIESKTRIANIIYTPSDTSIIGKKEHYLFKIDKDGNLTPSGQLKNDLNINYLGKVVEVNDTSTITTGYYVKFSETSNPMRNLISDEKPNNLGYAYNVPMICKMEFGKDDSSISGELIKLPQFGHVAYLSRKQSKAIITYDSLTGELLSISTSSNTNNSESITSTGTSVGALINSLKNDEAAELERQVKILELKKKLQELTSE